MRRGWYLIVALGALVVVPGASADTLTPSQATAVSAITKAEQSMKQPTSLAQVHTQQATIQSQVDKVIASANMSEDSSAVDALMNNTSAPGSPAVHAAILKDSQQYSITSQTTYASAPPDPNALGGTDPCWGANDNVYTRQYWGGIWTAGWISIVSSGWCGTGSTITWFPGFWGRQYTSPGYCFTSESWNYGSYIAYWWWVHGGHWAQLGIDIPLIGCASLSGGGATLREWSNGYWDTNY